MYMNMNSSRIRFWDRTLGCQSDDGQDVDKRVVLCGQDCSKLRTTRTIWETNTKDYLHAQDVTVSTAVIIPPAGSSKEMTSPDICS